MVMYERFTESARRVVAIAEREAFGRGIAQVEPEDVLIALAQHHGVAGSVLRAVAADPTLLRDGLHAREPAVAPATDRPRPLPLAHVTVQAFGLAAREADGLGVAFVGTEHLLLGLLRESTGRVPSLLVAVRRDPGLIRERTFDLVASPGFVSPEQPASEQPTPIVPDSTPPVVHARGGEAEQPTRTPDPVATGGFDAADRALLVQLAAEIAHLRDEVSALRAELARAAGAWAVREDHEDRLLT